MKRWIPALSMMLVLLASAVPVSAQAASEANGTVTDLEGNPIQGVMVYFHAESNPSMEYKGKTSKKGRYFVPGLFTGKQGDRWVIRVEADNLIPVEMTVESRTGNRVLIGDIKTVALGMNTKIPPIVIRPLGSATVDFKMSPPELVAQAAQEAAAAAAEAAGTAPKPRQQDPYEAALTRAQSGDLEGSVPMFIKAIDKEPEDAERHRAYAQVLYRLGHYDQAAAEAQQAIELDGSDMNARMVLYGIYVKQGDLDAAGQTLAAAKELDPNNLDLLKQVAFVASETGTIDEQIVAYEAIAAAAPNDSEAWLSLGDLYAQTGQNEKSEAAFQKVVELDPENADQVFFNLGALLINSDDRSEADTQKAIGAFRKAVEINPKYAPAYRELGFALLNTGDRAGAKEALEGYIKAAPNAADVGQMKAIVEAL